MWNLKYRNMDQLDLYVFCPCRRDPIVGIINYNHRDGALLGLIIK